MAEKLVYRPTAFTLDENHTDVTEFAGIAVRESAATADVATVRLRHGSVTGTILMVIELAANESAVLFLPGSIATPLGVYVEDVAGTSEGTLYST